MPDSPRLVYDPPACEHDVEGTGPGLCDVAATWIVQAPGEVITAGPCGCRAVTPLGDVPSWRICQVHLGEAVMLCADGYGEPVTVRTVPLVRVPA